MIFVAQSTRVKSITSYKDTAFGILPRTKIVPLESKGVKKALRYIVVQSKKDIFITPSLICDVHSVGFGFIFPQWAGKFRTIEVTVGAYEPPHHSRVPELVKTLCDDLNERITHLPPSDNQEQFLAEVISLLAWFQHRFVWIHPFQDYNGRVARLLTNFLLLRLGLPILEIKANTKKDREWYVQAIQAADKSDYSQLEDLLLNALKETLQLLK